VFSANNNAAYKLKVVGGGGGAGKGKGGVSNEFK
jgi:hypothetical protein